MNGSRSPESGVPDARSQQAGVDRTNHIKLAHDKSQDFTVDTRLKTQEVTQDTPHTVARELQLRTDHRPINSVGNREVMAQATGRAVSRQHTGH